MPAVYHTPTGPANLAVMFPSINWNDVSEYFIEVLDGGSTVLATTPVFSLDGCEDDLSVTFVNYLGQLDSATFKSEIEHDTKSTTFQKGLLYPLAKSRTGITRLQITSNDNYTCTCVLEENQMQWFDEFLDSPLAWMQFADTQGQAAVYVPIVITDQSSVKKKLQDRYAYEVTVKFSLSHERITIAN